MRFDLSILALATGALALALPAAGLIDGLSSFDNVPQIEKRAIWAGIAKGLAKLKGGSKWPDLKAKLNEPKPPAPEHVPFSGPILDGKIKGKDGRWVKYEPGMEMN